MVPLTAYMHHSCMYLCACMREREEGKESEREKEEGREKERITWERNMHTLTEVKNKENWQNERQRERGREMARKKERKMTHTHTHTQKQNKKERENIYTKDRSPYPLVIVSGTDCKNLFAGVQSFWDGLLVDGRVKPWTVGVAVNSDGDVGNIGDFWSCRVVHNQAQLSKQGTSINVQQSGQT